MQRVDIFTMLTIKICKRLMYVQCCQLKFTRIWSSHQAQQWVRNFCNYKKLSFAGLRELEESTLATPTTINKDEYDGIHISNIKHNNNRVSIGHLNIQSLISSFNKFHWMLHTPVFVWYTDPIRNLAKIQQTSNQIKYVEISYH